MSAYEALPDNLADVLREALAQRVLDVFVGMPADLARDSISHALASLENRSEVVRGVAPGLVQGDDLTALNQRLEALYQAAHAAGRSSSVPTWRVVVRRQGS